MKKWFLFIAVIFAVSCEKSETYDNPYYTKEQFAVIETLCNHEWLNVKEFNYYSGCRFYTINHQPFNIFYSAGNCIETVDGIHRWQTVFTYEWNYFKLNFEDPNNPTINFYNIETSSSDPTRKLDWIITNLPPTAPNIHTVAPSPLKIWEEQGLKYISFYQDTCYCK